MSLYDFTSAYLIHQFLTFSPLLIMLYIQSEILDTNTYCISMGQGKRVLTFE